MPIETHGFGTGGAKKIAEDVGHGGIGSTAPLWGAIREAIQWPPAIDREPPIVTESGATYYHENRVRDAYRDFTGYLIGAQVTILVLGALLAWRW